MRWVLEYRFDENENKSPKAPFVIFGYLDPEYEKQTSSISIYDEKHQTVVTAIWSLDGSCLQPRETSVEHSCKDVNFSEISGL